MKNKTSNKHKVKQTEIMVTKILTGYANKNIAQELSIPHPFKTIFVIDPATSSKL
jgi:hypothetical protein